MSSSFLPAFRSPFQSPVAGRRGAVDGIPSDIKSLITATNSTLRTLAGPTHQFAAAAGQVPDGLGGVQVNTIPPVHSAGYYGGPAYTNLFAGGPTGVEAEVLTAQKYCLQCVGGSVDAGAYGTATPSAPLIFTASAASQNFTPTGCTAWMLSAAGGYVFPIIPPGQSVVSTVGTTTSNGIQVPLTGSDAADRLIESFRGVPDGTELVTNGALTNFTSWGTILTGANTVTQEAGGARFNFTGADTAQFLPSPVLNIPADRYLVSFDVAAGSTGQFKIVPFGAPSETILNATTLAGTRYEAELTVPSSGNFAFSRIVGQACNALIDNVSIQKLTPAVGTVGALMRIGAGSAEIPNSTVLNILSVKDSSSELLFSSIGASSEDNICRSNDGATSAAVTVTTWSRNELHMKFVEFSGNKFRVGNKRYTEAGVAIDANIVWSHATLAGGATFDGSFNPTTLLRWFFNSTVPNWMRVMVVSNLAGLGDTELLRRITKYGKF